MKIYCNNLDCPQNEKLDKPVPFKPNKNYVPLFKSEYLGQCLNRGYDFIPIETSNATVEHRLAGCCVGKGESETCLRRDCTSNVEKKCDKEIIFVDKVQSLIDSVFWGCRCYSIRAVTGHINIMRFVDQPGGVSLTDSEAERLDHDNRVAKMFPTGMRPAKERSKKPLMPPQIRRR